MRRIRRSPIGPVLLAPIAWLLLGADSGPDAPPDASDFGAGISLTEPTRLETLLDAPDAYAGKNVLVRGRLTDVCQKKGCWTILRDGESSVRVRFLDYAFFLPSDAVGREALVEGEVSVRVLSEKDARHYAEETAGGSPEEIHGPQREVGFVARGVRLLAAR